jgi:hypothetical protein
MPGRVETGGRLTATYPPTRQRSAAAQRKPIVSASIPRRVCDCNAVAPSFNRVAQHVALHEGYVRAERQAMEWIAFEEGDRANSEVEIDSPRQRRGSEKGNSPIGSRDFSNDLPN